MVYIVSWELWALVSPPTRRGSRYIDWGTMSPNRKGVEAQVKQDTGPNRLDAGWTIEKVTLSSGWGTKP